MHIPADSSAVGIAKKGSRPVEAGEISCGIRRLMQLGRPLVRVLLLSPSDLAIRRSIDATSRKLSRSMLFHGSSMVGGSSLDTAGTSIGEVDARASRTAAEP